MSSSSGRTICKLLQCGDVKKPPGLDLEKTKEHFEQLFKLFRMKTRELSGNSNYQFTSKKDSNALPYSATLEFYDGESVNPDVSGVFYIVSVHNDEKKMDLIAGEYELVDDIILLKGYSHGTRHHYIYALAFNDSDECYIELIKTAPIIDDPRTPITVAGGLGTKSRLGFIKDAADDTVDAVVAVAKVVAKTVVKVYKDVKKIVQNVWKAIIKSALGPLLKDVDKVLAVCNNSGISIVANIASIAATIASGDITGVVVALAECLTDYIIGKNRMLQTFNSEIQTFIAAAMLAADFGEDLTAITAVSDVVNVVAPAISTIDDAKSSIR